MNEIRIRDGFPGEVMYVVPRPMLENAASHPLVHPLTPTDIGWFPNAKYHYRERPEGTPEHILIMCVAGEGWYEINGTRQKLLPGEALIIPRQTPHAYGASQESPWSIHWVHFIGAIGDYYVQQCERDQYTITVAPETAVQMEKLFCNCRDAFIANFVLQRMIYASQTLHHLLGTLVFNNRAFSPLLRSSNFHSLDETLNFLHENIPAHLSLDEMAQHAGLSRSHFVRLFKEQTHYSPMDYFIHLKMQHACMLLSLSIMTIREIAYSIGYEDQYYFSRVFKKTIGVSPVQYRKNTHNFNGLEMG